jgi:hypothetical protein
VSFHHVTIVPNYQQFCQLHSVREAANSGSHFLFDDITHDSCPEFSDIIDGRRRDTW